MIPYNVVADVLGRVDMLVADSSEEIASRLLLDHAAMAEIDRSSAADRDDLIEHHIATKTEEMQQQLSQAEAAHAEERKARIAAERDRDSMQEQLEHQRALVESLSQRVSVEAEARQKAEQDSATNRQQADDATAKIAETQKTHGQELQALKKTIEDQRQLVRRFGRYAAGGGLVFLALAGAIVPLATGWVSGGWAWVAVIILAGAVAYGGLTLIMGKKAAAVVSIVLAIVTFGVDLHSIAPSSHSSKLRSRSQSP